MPAPTSTTPHTDRRPLLGGIALGVAMLLVGVGIAVTGHNSSSAEEPPAASAAPGSAGRRVVAVTLADMDIKPARIAVRSGSRLVLDVTNRDFTRHDLAFPGGPRTPMLGPGNSARLDLGTVTHTRTGWCTVPGHKAAGMILTVAVTHGQSSQPGMPAMHGTDAAGKSSAHDARLDPAARPPATFRARDADLPPVPPGQVHHVTLRAIDRTLEVAPGVRQRMWTFNGTVPGPILHGRLGDTFVVTLINESSMGHSIDFHAGMGAPDTMMRTIAPGHRLTYRFTANHAGAWMYHCATEPMIDHIGNGMYGAVIIDPPHLSAVDHQWVVVQSELYFGPQGQHGDFAKMAAGTPDAVVFNGYANQYDYAPLHARAGDRVRTWVVDAGLARPTAFHIVGTQFDTVFKEGAYLVRRHNAQDGAAQALDLQPGEGGFVETTLPAAGHYPVIDHVMVDAARGAHGSITVSR